MPAKRFPGRWTLLAALVLLACAAGWIVWNKLSSDRFARQLDQRRPAAQAQPATQDQPPDPDVQRRRLIVGTWADEYEGKRTMTLRADGTGTMLVELSGWKAKLSAPRLTFNLKWSVQHGHFQEQTTGGEPAARVKMIMLTMGDHVDQPILELTADRLLLLDGNGKTKYDWKRVKTP